MNKDMVKVEPIALLPTPSGCAVFLSEGKKVILIYIDPSIGASINMALQGEESPRPMTHDLFHGVLGAFGAEVTQIIIVDAQEEVFYARMFIEVENELMHKKIIEVDARPSDSIALAVRDNTPIYVLKKVWSKLNDVSDLLEDMKKAQGDKPNLGDIEINDDEPPF